jgi:hypothetical protein
MTKPIEHLCPVPPEMEKAAAEAEQRKVAALERLQRLAEGAPVLEPDSFEKAMQALIDADKAALEARGR